MDIDLSSAKDKELQLPVGYGVALEQHVWKTLPKELLEMILMRLPHGARCRLRCVCQKWKTVLVLLPYQTESVPAYTIWGERFFCHSEKKWFALPSNDLSSLEGKPGLKAKDIFNRFTFPRNVPPFSLGRNSGRTWSNWEAGRDLQKLIFPSKVYPSSKTTWHVVDVDAEFICYFGNIEGNLWLRVSNPLTSFFQVIPPDYPRRDPQRDRAYTGIIMLKLLVDRETQTFKVVLLSNHLLSTMVYCSSTSRWYACSSHLCQGYSANRFSDVEELFTWRNTVYAYGRKQYHHEGNFVVTFDTELGKWKKVEARFPCELGFETNCLIVSDNDRVILIQSSLKFKGDSKFSVWKLLDDGSRSNSSYTLFSEWEKVIVPPIGVIEESSEGLTRRRLDRACLGREHICFTFSGFKPKRGAHGSKVIVCKCVKYSFTPRIWSVIPGAIPCSGEFSKFYHWEPSVDGHGSSLLE